MKNKLHRFKAVILAAPLYDSEVCALTTLHLRRLKSFVMRCVRTIIRISVKDRMHNTKIR